MNAKLMQLYFELQGAQVEYLTPAQAAQCEAQWREDLPPDITLKAYLLENNVVNTPREGWSWLVELNSEEVAGGYGYATAEAAGLAAIELWGSERDLEPSQRHTPEWLVTHELLADCWFGIRNVGETVLLPDDNYGRVDIAYYAKRLREWVRLANKGDVFTLEQVWGFTPDLTANNDEAYWQRETWFGAQTLKLAQARLESLVPITELRVACCGYETRQKGDLWEWNSPDHERWVDFISERGMLVFIAQWYDLLPKYEFIKRPVDRFGIGE